MVNLLTDVKTSLSLALLLGFMGCRLVIHSVNNPTDLHQQRERRESLTVTGMPCKSGLLMQSDIQIGQSIDTQQSASKGKWSGNGAGVGGSE